jgi:hypothetical protein
MIRLLFILFFLPLFSFGQDDTLERFVARQKAEKIKMHFDIDPFITDIALDTATGTFTWSTYGEKDTALYIIEEFRWGKWYKLGEVKKKGEKHNHYSIHLPVDSGLYYVCVTAKDKDGRFKGRGIHIPEKECKVKGIACSRNAVILNCPSRFEIMDKYGKIVKYGYASYISTADLEAGVYYFNYNNITTEIIARGKK